VLLHTSASPVLLTGDAAWHTYQVEDIRQKSSYPGGLADEDRAEAFGLCIGFTSSRTA